MPAPPASTPGDQTPSALRAAQDALAARCEKLEELALFADRRADLLDQALQTLGQDVQRLTRRVRQLEQRLEQQQTSGDEPTDESGSSDEPSGQGS